MKNLACYCLVLIFVLCFSISRSQSINYDKIIPNDSIASTDIGEKLVQLAWKNNPDNNQVIDASKSASYEYRASTWTWLNSLVASGNLNEFTIKGTSSSSTNNNNLFFPRYNFGLTLPLGIYPVNHYITRSLKKKYDVENDKVNSQKLEIRRKVLNAYQDFLLAKELLKIQTSTTDEASTQYLVMQKKFKDNRGTLQAYNEAQQKYNIESITKITYQRNYIVSKNELERLIGINLEEILKP